MSTRSQFRSASGCCICGTKSSSSRFSNSSRFSQYFSKCFGPKGEGRSGDICNACVLYVKRWCKGPDKISGKYEKVLDKKKGPGLKHITQIVKMEQRQEARMNAFGGHGMETRSSKNHKSSEYNRQTPPRNASQINDNYVGADGFYSCFGPVDCVEDKDVKCSCLSSYNDDSFCADSSNNSCSSSKELPTLIHHHHYHHHHYNQFNCSKSGGSSASTRSFISQNSSSLSMGSTSSGCMNTSGLFRSLETNIPQNQTAHSTYKPCDSGIVNSNSSVNTPLNSSVPNIPGGLQCNNGGLQNIQKSSVGSASADSMGTSDVFRVPQPCGSKAKNYKRRVHLKPVKLPNEDEVDNLLREIMARNSQVVNFEIPLAMQNHLRLRSRTIMPNGNITLSSGASSTNDQCSVSSDSFGSSVGNVDSLRN